MKRNYKIKTIAAMLAAVMLVLNAGSNVYADNVYVENESTEQLTNEGYEENFEGDLTISELEQYYEDVGEEGTTIHNNEELIESLIEDKKNRIESYEYMLKEETDPAALEEIQNMIETLKAELSELSINSIAVSGELPSKVDIITDSATGKYFPVIGDQGSKGSCQFFSMYYYMFSYEANRINNRSYRGYVDAYSPEWGYVQYFNNRGGIIDALKNFGAVKYNDFEYNTQDGKDTSLSSVKEDALLEALKTRLVDYDRIQLYTDDQTNPVNDGKGELLTQIKNVLKGGKPLRATCCVNLESHKTTSGEEIITRIGVTATTHAVTIVGYDDNIWWDEDGDGVKDKGEVGALKIANSWGTGWGNNGYCWILYDALNADSQIEGVKNRQNAFTKYGAFWFYLEYFNVKAYRPKLIAKLKFYGWNPDKTSVSWGSYTNMNKCDEDIRLLNHQKTDYLTATRLYDYADSADTVDEIIGEQYFGIKVGNNKDAGDKDNHFRMITCSLMDSKKNIIQNNSSNITTNGTVRFDTRLKLGDIDYDKTISKSDAETVLKMATGINTNPSNLQTLLADYNQDGKVNLYDAQAVSSVAK